MIRFLPRKTGHLRKGVKLTMLDTGETKKLHSEWLIVPGAHDYNRVLGAPNIVIVLNALDFFYSTFWSKCHRLR